MIINGLGGPKTIHLGSLFAFLSHLEAKIYDFRLFEGFRGVFRAPNTKIGYKVTSYGLEMIINGLGDLKLLHLGSSFAFITYLSWHMQFSPRFGGPGTLADPQNRVRGVKKFGTPMK